MSKHEKWMGNPPIKDERRSLAMPDKVTPKASGKKHAKPYGYSYVYEPSWAFLRKRDGQRSYRWYKSEVGRDQALEVELMRAGTHERKYGYPYMYQDFRKEER